jgi:ABC-2 type transport system ATP-binding protein
VLGLLGPNGSGKTTALRILCGLLKPSEGSVRIDGHDVQQGPVEARKHLSFVPEGAPLYANLSPRRHLMLVGRLHGMSEAEVLPEADRLLDALDLGERANDPVGEFSTGMRQKTALACALLPKPPLLILDEPLNGLDAPTTVVFKEVLRAWADRGGSVLYTSHLLDVAERICDRVAILYLGRLAALGTLDELRARTGQDGTLEEVFGTITHTEDPREKARKLLG